MKSNEWVQVPYNIRKHELRTYFALPLLHGHPVLAIAIFLFKSHGMLSTSAVQQYDLWSHTQKSSFREQSRVSFAEGKLNLPKEMVADLDAEAIDRQAFQVQGIESKNN